MWKRQEKQQSPTWEQHLPRRSWLDNSSSSLTCEDHSAGGALPRSGFCLFPRSDSLWSLRFFFLWVVRLTGDCWRWSASSQKGLGLVLLWVVRKAVISRHELRNHLHLPDFTHMSVFPFFSKMTNRPELVGWQLDLFFSMKAHQPWAVTHLSFCYLSSRWPLAPVFLLVIQVLEDSRGGQQLSFMCWQQLTGMFGCNCWCMSCK